MIDELLQEYDEIVTSGSGELDEYMDEVDDRDIEYSDDDYALQVMYLYHA